VEAASYSNGEVLLPFTGMRVARNLLLFGLGMLYVGYMVFTAAIPAKPRHRH
jgi:hypothetical protein